MSFTLFVLADYTKAEQITKESLGYFPDSDVLWYQLAMTEYQLHNHTNALASVKMALTINPTQEYNSLYQIIITKQKLPPPSQDLFEVHDQPISL